jgi:hypothetical protein
VRNKNWGRITIEALILGVIIYVVMRFLVPHSIVGNTRSLIGGAVAFISSMIISRVGTRSK